MKKEQEVKFNCEKLQKAFDDNKEKFDKWNKYLDGISEDIKTIENSLSKCVFPSVEYVITEGQDSSKKIIMGWNLDIKRLILTIGFVEKPLIEHKVKDRIYSHKKLPEFIEYISNINS